MMPHTGLIMLVFVKKIVKLGQYLLLFYTPSSVAGGWTHVELLKEKEETN